MFQNRAKRRRLFNFKYSFEELYFRTAWRDKRQSLCLDEHQHSENDQKTECLAEQKCERLAFWMRISLTLRSFVTSTSARGSSPTITTFNAESSICFLKARRWLATSSGSSGVNQCFFKRDDCCQRKKQSNQSFPEPTPGYFPGTCLSTSAQTTQKIAEKTTL